MDRLKDLCFITPERIDPAELESLCRVVLDAGCRWIQYRRKTGSRRELYAEALRLCALAHSYGARFVVNDYADVALAIEADGVHLGQDDLPLAEARGIMGTSLIGISTHSMEEAREAADGGADYIGFGPIYPTLTKDAGPAQGLQALAAIVKSVPVPVIAIGGITPERAAAVAATGCRGVAVSSAIAGGFPSDNVRLFLESPTGCRSCENRPKGEY